MSVYAIDIDGVIGKKIDWAFAEVYQRGRKVFANIPVDKKVITRINLLYDAGNTIVLHTSRIWHDYDVTVRWLKKNGVKYNILIMAKPLADYYVDDRNMSVQEFIK